MQENASPQPSEEQLKDSSASQEPQPSQANGEETPRSQTLSSKELPRWLRSELEAGKPQEIEEKAGATPESPEREVRQFREELASTQRPMAALGNQSSSRQERQYVERGGCLTSWLIFVGIVNALALILGMTSPIGPLSLFYIANGLIALIGVVGTWQMKKWGYYILLALYLIGLVGSVLSMGSQSALSSSAISMISSLVGLVITSILVLGKWEDFE
jgi:hypothetical protein